MPMLNPAYQQNQTNTWIVEPSTSAWYQPSTDDSEISEEGRNILEEDKASIKESLILEPTGYSVDVYIIAYSSKRNMLKRISCNKVKPLGNWCYDLNTDTLMIECSAYAHLGRFPVGYKMKMEGVEGWSVEVPLSEAIIEKRICGEGKKVLDRFKAEYPSKENSYSFVQCSGVFRSGQEF